MRGLATFCSIGALALMALVGSARATPGNDRDAGEESAELTAAGRWFQDQRAAPNEVVNEHAYASLAQQAAALPTIGGTWTERTTGHDFSDSPDYHDGVFNDPATSVSNSGAGARWVSGRVTALATAANGDLYAGAASGGVWRSTDGGTSWTPVTDHVGSLSTGALAVDDNIGSPYTVYLGTGEANANSDSYAGIGVLRSTDGGTTWTRMGSGELDGAVIFRLAVNSADHSVYAATSHGLYRSTPTGGWTLLLNFDAKRANASSIPVNARTWNLISDVLLLPGGRVLAAAGSSFGDATNGLYYSTDGGSNFTSLSPKGWVPAQKQGRVTLAASADARQLYAVVQDATSMWNGAPIQSGTDLAGVFTASAPDGPWTLIADAGKLAASGSAMGHNTMGKGYQPGVQASYNQFLAVDPANARHVYLGLEEVYETQDAGVNWKTIGPYWNFSLPDRCFAYQPFEGTCNHDQLHSDQHAVAISGNSLYVGNDGGVYRKALNDHTQGNWTDLNQGIDTLQAYAGTAGQVPGDPGPTIFGGLQDNGTVKVFPTPTQVHDDRGQLITVNAVQPFGGDGGYTIVDPSNPANVITEYTFLQSFRSNDGGRSWVEMAPGDPSAKFIAPITADSSDHSHIVAGGADVWDSTAGFATSSTDWRKVYDLTQGGAHPIRGATALATTTSPGGVVTTWVGWCGPCRGATNTGTFFDGGVTVLDNQGPGGTWRAVKTLVGGIDLPKRYVSSITIDPTNPQRATVSFSGYSRKWTVGPDDPGIGHVYDVNGTGGAWTATDRSGDLPDGPVESLLAANGTIVAGTDLGVYASTDGGAHWGRLGQNLPDVVVSQLTLEPDGRTVLAATHGRGFWTIPLPSP